MDAFILRNGLFINKNSLSPELIRALKNHFKLQYTNTLKHTTYLTLLNELTTDKASYVILPVYGGIEYLQSKKFTKLLKEHLSKIEKSSNFEESKTLKSPQINIKMQIQLNTNQINIKRVGKPTANQQVIADHIMSEYFTDSKVSQGLSRLILDLDTGCGKSYLAAELIHRLKVRTLVVVPNSTLLFDWEKKVLKKEFPNSKIGVYYGKEKIMGDIVVGVINSLVQSTEFTFTTKEGKGKTKTQTQTVLSPAEFFKQFDFVVIDETQCYCSKENKKIFWKTAPYVLGLSATPTETQFYKASEWGIGPIVQSLNINGFEKTHSNFQGKVRMIKYHGHYTYTKTLLNETTGNSCPSSSLNLLIRDPHRITLAVDEILKIAKTHFVFVFSERRNLNEEIGRLLKEHDIKCDVLMGGIDKESIENAEANANVIISTYSYMGTGKSIPKMSAMVLLTPRKSKIKQIIGRILRLGGDESVVRQIVDIVDYKTIFRGQWSQRKKFYETKGYEIETEEAKYTQFKKTKVNLKVIKGDELDESESEDDTESENENENDEIENDEIEENFKEDEVLVKLENEEYNKYDSVMDLLDQLYQS